MEKASLELLLAQGVSIERIAQRFGKDPATISYWVRKHGLESPYRAKHAAKGGIERERLVGLVERGDTITEIPRSSESVRPRFDIGSSGTGCERRTAEEDAVPRLAQRRLPDR